MMTINHCSLQWSIARIACALCLGLVACVDNEEGASSECMDDSPCLETADSYASVASHNGTMPPPFERSECEERASGSATCLCYESNGVVSAQGRLRRDVECNVVSVRSRRCLFTGEEFAGCDLDQPDTSCDDACAEVHALLVADAARTVNATARAGICDNYRCFSLIEIEGACFINGSYEPVSCELSDEEIVAAGTAGSEARADDPD